MHDQSSSGAVSVGYGVGGSLNVGTAASLCNRGSHLVVDSFGGLNGDIYSLHHESRLFGGFEDLLCIDFGGEDDKETKLLANERQTFRMMDQLNY